MDSDIVAYILVTIIIVVAILSILYFVIVKAPKSGG
jgi:hypothetical protein